MGAFQSVLCQLPTAHESVRLAIGHCMLRLGREGDAEAAFARVLAVNPRSISALVATAILHLNRGPSGLAMGMQLLKQAYDLDKTNPTVLYHLANHFFYKKEYTKATALASSAMQCVHPGDEAACSYMMGKIQHAQGLYSEAFQAYSEAVKINPNLVLAQLGLGQVCLHRCDWASAADCFDRVVTLCKATSPNPIGDADFWAMLGLTRLCVPVSNSPEPHGFIKKAIALGARSFDLVISLAILHETSNASEALKSYRMAREMDAKRFASRPDLLNNYAVMLHQCEQLSEAAAVLAEAGALALSSPSTSDLFRLIRFNEARLMEDRGQLSEAEAVYKALLCSHPNDLDVSVHLRLGIIAARRGQASDASEHYKEAIGLNEGDVDSWVLLASNHLRIRALTPARKAYERILKSADRHEVFSLTALGNIYIEIARHEKRLAVANEHLRRALEFFIKALQVQPHNYVAANGIGVVFAELGRYKEAKEVFLQVKQAAPAAFVDATLSLGHCFVELGQHAAALHAYESLVPRTHGHRLAALYLFLSRASYVQAKTERDPPAFNRAVQYLQSAQQLLPDDQPIRFNLALCQQEVAAALLKRGVGAMTDEAVMEALAMLDAAHTTFTQLATPTTEEAGIGEGAAPCSNNAPVKISAAIDLKIVEQRRKYCQTLKQSLHARLEAIRAATSSRQAKLDAVRQQRQESLAAEKALQAASEEARRQEQARSEAIRKELAAKLKVTEDSRPPSSDDSDYEGQGEEDSDGGVKRVRQRKKRKDAGRPRKRRAVAHRDSDDEIVGDDDDGNGNSDGDNDSDQINPVKQPRNNDDGDEDDVMVRGRQRNRISASLSKEFISESDQEENSSPQDLGADND